MKHIVFCILFFQIFATSMHASENGSTDTKELSSSSLPSTISSSGSFRNFLTNLIHSDPNPSQLESKQRLRVLSIAQYCQSSTRDNNPTLIIECERIPEKTLREICRFYSMKISGSTQHALFVAYKDRAEKLSQGAHLQELDLNKFTVDTHGTKMKIIFKEKE